MHCQLHQIDIQANQVYVADAGYRCGVAYADAQFPHEYALFQQHSVLQTDNYP